MNYAEYKKSMLLEKAYCWKDLLNANYVVVLFSIYLLFSSDKSSLYRRTVAERASDSSDYRVNHRVF